jgi:hypothetical protein
MNWIHYNDTTRQATINLDEIKTDTATAWQLDQLGSIREKFNLHEGENIIDCSHWGNGTWFIKVEARQGVQLKKILITA